MMSAAGAQSPPSGPAAPAKSPAENRADLILADGLGDKNPDVRKQAVAALGLIGPREPYVREIYNALVDKDLSVRLMAVSSLVDIRDKGMIPALAKALEDETPEVSFAAAKALLTLGDPAGRKALLAVLDKESKTSSGFLTAKKRDMLRMFHTPRQLMIFAVKTGVGMAPVPGLGEGVASVEGILSDNGVSGRATAALMLASDRSPEVLVALQEALADDEASVRAAAAHAIALRDDPALAPQLLKLFDDAKEPVRLRAAAGYLRLSWLRVASYTPPLSGKKGKKK
jgi:HEAT repeat protein